MLGHHRRTSETPFKWRFACGPMMARLQWQMDPLSLHQLKKYIVKVGSPLTKHSGSVHVVLCCNSRYTFSFGKVHVDKVTLGDTIAQDKHCHKPQLILTYLVSMTVDYYPSYNSMKTRPSITPPTIRPLSLHIISNNFIELPH